MQKILISLLLYFLFISCSQSQGPEDIAIKYFKYLKENNWYDSAKLYDKDELKSFRETMSFIMELPTDQAKESIQLIFGEGKSIQHIREMSHQEFFSSFMNGVIASQLGANQLNFEKFDIIGSVPGGDSLMHVVYRMYFDVDDLGFNIVGTISFRKSESGWGMLLKGEIKNLAQHAKSFWGIE